MTYRAWNTKTVDRAALKELTAAIAQQNTEELEYQNMDEEWSEEKYRSVLAAQQKEAGLLAGILGMTQYVISTPGFISIPAYIDPTGSSYNLIVSIIVMVVAVVLGFVATYILGKRALAKK